MKHLASPITTAPLRARLPTLTPSASRGSRQALFALCMLTAVACGSITSSPDASAIDASVDSGESDAEFADAACEPPPSPRVFEHSGALETFAVPDCVSEIVIEAYGAQGGDGVLPGATGGRGARIRGQFAVETGDVVTVLVGERGAEGVPIPTRFGQGGGCGGGGTFVHIGDTPVLVAGGGGGATSNNNQGVDLALPGGDAQIGESGQPGDGNGAGSGGLQGSGGVTGSNSGFHVGTAGGGLLSAGIGASDGDTLESGTPNQPGQSYDSGGAGGIGGSQGRDGAFGGGGSAGFTGGGGGGYSGGGTASTGGTRGGGGGGSLNMGGEPMAEAGVREGNGLVVISW